jgi:predicted acyl esterase
MTSNPAVFPGGSRLQEVERWLRRFIKPGEPLEPEAPPVRVFVMGGGSGAKDGAGRLVHGGTWRVESEWPISRAVATNLYLAPDHVLGWAASSGGESSTFVYDPASPLPTISANTSSLNEILPTPDGVITDSPLSQMRLMVIQGGANQATDSTTAQVGTHLGPLHERSDVVWFETQPLESAVEVTGPIEAVIHLSTDVADTDLFVMVQDVYPRSPDWPDGYALNVSDGIMRVRYRHGFGGGIPMTADSIEEVRFQLYPTSNLFADGHSVRVLVSSSSFPRFDPNPNTGEPIGRHTHSRLATNVIHHGERYPSRIVVPIVPRHR